jgi:hypothetical protein
VLLLSCLAYCVSSVGASASSCHVCGLSLLLLSDVVVWFPATRVLRFDYLICPAQCIAQVHVGNHVCFEQWKIEAAP